ncbi:MAG: hypothetical protein RR602_04895 [Longicatena sp.]
MYKSVMDLNYPIEHIIYQLSNINSVEEFIDKDYAIRTKYLKNKNGFVSKSIWVNDSNPGEIHAILTWEDYISMTALSKEEQNENERKFSDEYIYEFKDVTKIVGEKDWELFKFCTYENNKGFNE